MSSSCRNETEHEVKQRSAHPLSGERISSFSIWNDSPSSDDRSRMADRLRRFSSSKKNAVWKAMSASAQVTKLKAPIARFMYFESGSILITGRGRTT